MLTIETFFTQFTPGALIIVVASAIFLSFALYLGDVLIGGGNWGDFSDLVTGAAVAGVIGTALWAAALASVLLANLFFGGMVNA